MTYTHSCFIRYGASFGVIFRGAPSLWLAHARTVETNLCFPPMKGYVLIRRMLFVATLPVFFSIMAKDFLFTAVPLRRKQIQQLKPL